MRRQLPNDVILMSIKRQIGSKNIFLSIVPYAHGGIPYLAIIIGLWKSGLALG
jgi:hypothetical protein